MSRGVAEGSPRSAERVGWPAPGGAGHLGSKPAIGTIGELSARYSSVVEKAAPGVYAAKPQHVWRWQIAGYLYLGGLGAGAFAVAVVLDWLGFGLMHATASQGGDWVWDWSQAVVLWGPLATGVGASMLILDLGRNWWRFFTAGNNPRTSWMARGFSILLSFIVLSSVVAAVSIFAPEWRYAAPSWWSIVEVMAVAAALGTAFYTGVLLRSMTYISAWSSLFVPPLFMVSALSTGSMGVLVGCVVLSAVGGDAVSAERSVHALEVFEPVLIAIEAVILVLYVRSLGRGKPEAALSARILLRGDWRYAFWIGVVGCALAIPLALDLINLPAGSRVVAMVAALSVLVGGLILRLAVLGTGVKELPPLYRLGEWRGRHSLRPGG